MTFQTSSQAQQFIFTPEALYNRRLEAYKAASASFSVSMSFEDHIRYVNYYCDKLLESSQKINFNRFQRYTALALMQRVYIDRTIWEIPPPLAMISCLFLVSKFIRPETLDNLLTGLGFGEDFYQKFDPARQMAKVEIGVLTALDFKLKVYLPFHQVVAICDGKPFYQEHEKAQQKLFEILKTDALLLYPPAQLAVAALATVVGEEVAIEALGDVKVPEGVDLSQNINDILALEHNSMTPEEIKAAEESLGAEFAVFHVIERERKESAKNDGPTSMVPP
ncbi:hypothetical protein TRFO_28349 [Tritrichomonas foetus]|uniref:Uncharacterized protein n=1 Tax=Tritrichomonas foetus TaxID=1144522 RepID=A0A1J4JZ35_9EUKA|nr:hypothetical protein TRFO_28349 [Tritrichomonas foetus]|eukprot:OHT04235.1 hypothetical protein TRFO_28349 [Tritrichomonas foetus]